MDPFSNADFQPLVEEKFDFDVSLSSESSMGDEECEDEVFVGPVTNKEKVICMAVEYLAKDSVSSGPSVGEEQMWSPLTGDNFDRMCNEAQKLATQLKEDQQPHTGQTEGTVPAEKPGDMMDDFVQDTEAKLHMFSKPRNMDLSPIKRETFCVQDSPLKELPPAIQKRLLKGRSSTSSVGSGVGVNSTRARLSTSSPASGSKNKTKTQPKMALRSKAGLGTSGILPSKLVVPATTSATSLKTTAAAAPAEKPSRMAPPSKAALRSKAPHLQTRGVVDRRRNTSSSSSSVSSLNSSVSSFNCSMSVSPTGNCGKGNLNTSQNRSKNGTSSRAPTNVSRLANTSAAKTGQTRPSSLTSRAAESKPSAAATTVKGARRSISVQSRKTSETDPTKLARSTPVKRAAPSTPTPFQQSPAKRALMSSVPSLPQFGLRAKPVALIAPTPTSRLKGPKRSDDVVQSPDTLKNMKPKRLISGSMDSPTPALSHTPSMSKIRRPSALPTPVNRRISGIPTMTPKSLAGFCRPSPFMPMSARRTSNQSPIQLESAASEVELVISPKIQPFSLEDADPADLQQETQNEGPSCVSLHQAPEVVEHLDENQEPEASGSLMKLHSAEQVISEDHGAKTQEDVEILLVDVPEVFEASKPEDKTLIDLFNTPDLIRPLRPVALNRGGEKELIDLSSPLIKWSPEDKENAVKEAPLINISF